MGVADEYKRGGGVGVVLDLLSFCKTPFISRFRLDFNTSLFRIMQIDYLSIPVINVIKWGRDLAQCGARWSRCRHRNSDHSNERYVY